MNKNWQLEFSSLKPTYDILSDTVSDKRLLRVILKSNERNLSIKFELSR